jgi:hypothetical protein
VHLASNRYLFGDFAGSFVVNRLLPQIQQLSGGRPYEFVVAQSAVDPHDAKYGPDDFVATQ